MIITDQQAAFYDGFIEENVVRAGQSMVQVAYLLSGLSGGTESDALPETVNSELSPLFSDLTPLFAEIDTFALACWKLREAFWFVKTKHGVENEFDRARTSALQNRYGIQQDLFAEAHAVRRRIEHALEDIDKLVKGKATTSSYGVLMPHLGGIYVGADPLDQMLDDGRVFRCLTTSDMTYYQAGHSMHLPTMVRQLLYLIERGKGQGRFWKSTITGVVTALDPIFPAIGGYAFSILPALLMFDTQVYEPGYFGG